MTDELVESLELRIKEILQDDKTPLMTRLNRTKKYRSIINKLTENNND